MKKEHLHINNLGFSLVEILVAISVFLVFVLAISDVTVSSSWQVNYSVNTERATALAEEGLEATRNIRDADFANLSDGTNGLTTGGNQFNLSGSSDTTDIFNRTIEISTVDNEQKQVVATVAWSDQISPTNSVTLSTYLTDWRKITQTTCTDEQSFLEVDTSGAVLANSNRSLSGITIGSTATDCDIVISSISLTWTSNRRLQEITIDGSSVWIGSVTSGTTNDITDFTLVPGQSGVGTVYRFNNSMSGNTFSITYTMSDGTTKTISGIAP